MPAPYKLSLSPDQLVTLTEMRDHHPTPIVRTHAAALLKIAHGVTAPQVARFGLLRPYRPQTVNIWLKAYLQNGIVGLLVKPGAGRKPAFFPSAHPSQHRSG